MNLEELRERYVGTLPGKIASLEEALAELGAGAPQALDSLRGLAHKLVGSGGSYGFMEITRAARAVEEGDDDQLADLAADLLEVLRRVAN